MSDQFSIPANSVSTIWVFQIDLPETDIHVFKTQTPSENGELVLWPLRDALGVLHLNPDFVEVFQADTMAEYGMSRYLTEANGIDEISVAQDAAKLDALTGPVALVFSSALSDDELRLTPRAPLRLVGRYTESRDFTLRAAPTSEAALAPAHAPENKRPSDAAMSGRIATVALLLMGLFVWFLIWIS